MPIYEFYCPDCHALFNFLSKTVNTTKRPACPKCGRKRLEREVSMFALTGERRDPDGMDDLPIDESKMENAMEALAGEAEGLNEDDPREAARLMRKFSHMTGLEFGGGIEEAIGRMESGEDPDKIESDMGERLEDEEPFVMPGKGGGGAGGKAGKPRGAPRRDPTLHEM